mmetsp:Transcript_17602/g.49199  ORF Transcript_17602/g.49199 Transcript_17602/m.49199 type:complete len:133 (+) Transcript_17602:781-1179(+)
MKQWPPARSDKEISVLDGLPSDAKSVLIQWRRGAKLAETEPTAVNAEGNSASWNTRMQQVATIYKQDVGFQPKEYTLKVQTVAEKHGETVRKTYGKCKVDLAQFCSSESLVEKDILLKLRLPCGQYGVILLF